MAYVALIADMISSRELQADTRRSLQRDLREALERLNHELEDSLEVPLQITGGDEFQGLFRDGAAIVDVYVRLWERLEEIEFVYGMGFGGISTDLSEHIVEIDGPCFHRARSALMEAKKAKDPVHVNGAPASDALAVIFRVLDNTRRSWTPTQRKYVAALRRSSSRTAVAEEFDVSPAAVSQALKRGDYASFERAESAGRKLLQALSALSSDELQEATKFFETGDSDA